MRHAFVTGATGFVGLNLARRLLDGGWRVTALHRAASDLSRLEGLALERVAGDITDADDVRRAMPDGLDAVFHVAASTNMWSRRNAVQFATNVDGTRHVVDAALQRHAARLVHTSSIAAYGCLDGPFDEATPVRGASSWISYVRTKALAEGAVRAGIDRGLDAVIVNPANIVGPFDLRGWSTLIRLVHRGRLPGVPPGAGSFCHVDDVCDALIAAALRGGGGKNYLLGGADARYADVVRIIAELAGRPVSMRTTPAFVVRGYAWINEWIARGTGRRPDLTPEAATLVCGRLLCRSDRAVRELGYRTRPLREMLSDAYCWLRDAGRL